MKVKITNDSKKVITLSQMDAVKNIIRACAEDGASASDYAEQAVDAIMSKYNDSCVSVLKCSAEIAGNSRVWNRITDDSENLDVWISGVAECYEHYVRFGAYLSDIWGISGGVGEDYHMFSVVYREI